FFMVYWEFALEALDLSIYEIPFDPISGDVVGDGATSVAFVWCTSAEDVVYPSENQRSHLDSVIKDVERLLSELGEHKALYLSYVAQFHKACRQGLLAAEAYRRLIDMPDLLGQNAVPFGLEAAKLYKTSGRPSEAEQILRGIVERFPNSVECWEQLSGVLHEEQKTTEATEAAKTAAALGNPEHLRPETRLLSCLQPPTVNDADIKERLTEWKKQFELSREAEDELYRAFGQQLHAERSGQELMRYDATAAFYYCKAVEIELRNVFHRWRDTMTTSERKCFAGEAGAFDRELERFLNRRHKISMGAMDCVLWSANKTITVYKSFFDFLSLHHPRLLDDGTKQALSELTGIRNREGHSHSPSDAPKAEPLAKQIFQAMTPGS
ncbi:MAG: tetratricopeptide repeat protein, partial [Mycobacterium sp.]